MRIERNASATSIGLGIVEFAFVEALHDFDSIGMDSPPTQSDNLSDPLRFYDQRHENILMYTFSLTAAAATAQFAIYKILNGASVIFFKFAATLSGLVFVATLLLYMALLQNRLYFVYAARQLNAIRGYMMEAEAKGFKNNQMYTSFDFPALKSFSVHTFTLIGVALISSLFAGGCAYAIAPALGHAGCLAIGIETGVVVFVAEAIGGIQYLLSAGKKPADQVIHRVPANSGRAPASDLPTEKSVDTTEKPPPPISR